MMFFRGRKSKGRERGLLRIVKSDPESKEPVVSIGMPIYNAGKFLRLAVCSILNQTFEDWELIIIDDASTDGAIAGISDIVDSRIRIIDGRHNLGLATRLNEAVSLARGTYFARMDQDDVSHPERLAKQLAFLESDPAIDLLATQCVVINEKNEVTGVLPFRVSHEEICAAPWLGLHMPHPTWMGRTAWFRGNAYLSPGPYCCEDQELLLRTFKTSRFQVLAEPLLAYRVRNGISLTKLWRTRTTLLRLQRKYFSEYGRPDQSMSAGAAFLAKFGRDVLRKMNIGGSQVAGIRVHTGEINDQVVTFWTALIARLEHRNAGTLFGDSNSILAESVNNS